MLPHPVTVDGLAGVALPGATVHAMGVRGSGWRAQILPSYDGYVLVQGLLAELLVPDHPGGLALPDGGLAGLLDIVLASRTFMFLTSELLM